MHSVYTGSATNSTFCSKRADGLNQFWRLFFSKILSNRRNRFSTFVSSCMVMTLFLFCFVSFDVLTSLIYHYQGQNASTDFSVGLFMRDLENPTKKRPTILTHACSQDLARRTGTRSILTEHCGHGNKMANMISSPN